jgi:hypothetical protein
VIIAVAGRRAGLGTGDPFNPQHLPQTRACIRECLLTSAVTTVVGAAANGADLLALDAAADAAIRRRIILPTAIDVFRAQSVSDRPGPWSELFDRLIAEAQALGDLVLLGYSADDPTRFERGNTAILDEAVRLGAQSGESIEAVAIWEGAARGPHDHTATFIQEAEQRALAVRSIFFSEIVPWTNP